MPRSTPGVCPGTSIDWTGAEIRLSSHAKTTNEIQICFSITSHTKTKFISVLFFKVMRKRKTKYEVQIRFSKLGENGKRKVKFKSVFQSQAKTKNGHGT